MPTPPSATPPDGGLPEGRPAFLDAGGFPFTAALEREAAAIRAELDALLAAPAAAPATAAAGAAGADGGAAGDGFMPWPERHLYDSAWDVYGLHLFSRPIPEGCAACPRTAAALAHVPGLATAGFSRLGPGAVIRPHVGLNPAVLRCHLGLVAPPGCGLRVGGETRGWEAGRCLVFDDTLEHEAWNRSDRDRVVLLVDFARPG